MKIEDGIPVPKKKRQGRPYKYPFAEMKVGQSVKVKATYYTLMGCVKNFCAKVENAGVEFQIEMITKTTARIHRIK